MVYFFIAVAAHMLAAAGARYAPAPWLALAIGGLLITPNILNQTHGGQWPFDGQRHLTATSSAAQRVALGEQMCVFGPILFIV